MDQMSEVSSISEVKPSGGKCVFCLERCPQFRCVLVEGFHSNGRTCIHVDCTFSGSLVAVLRGKAESSSGVYLEQE